MSDEVDYGDYEEDTREEKGAGGGGEEEDAEALEMQRKIAEMDNELADVTSESKVVESKISEASSSMDENSVYIGQVDYEATAEELRAHFAQCGTINRITIMTNKFTGHSKGYAYIEFVDKDAVENALKLDDTPFKGRQIKVTPKREPITMQTGRWGGGRGGRGGRGGFRGGRGGRGGFRGEGDSEVGGIAGEEVSRPRWPRTRTFRTFVLLTTHARYYW